MAIQFYLEIEGKRYILPVNPGEIKVSSDSNNQTVEVVRLGDVNRFGGKTLRDVSLTSFFPKDTKTKLANPKAPKRTPQAWIKIITDAKDGNKRVRLIVTDTGINILMAIQSFEYGYQDATGDVEFNLSLKEYRNYSARKIKAPAKKRPAPAKRKPVTKGSTVIVNGRLHRDSFGNGSGYTEKNARRRVNFIKPGRKAPYHVTTLDGRWRGWVTAGSVRRA